MRKNYKALCSCLLLFIAIAGFAQQNSPWKTISNQTISGVYISPGCHEYSLTNGQGFSVYLKNTSLQTVNVTGILAAKTVCGNYVTSRFNVNLAPAQEANGSDFYNATSTGQTSVVSPTDCKGIRYAKLPYSKFINRIKTVTVSEVVVTALDSASSVPQASQIVVPSTTATIAQTAKSYVPVNVSPNVKFDSIAYLRKNWNYTQDSLNNTIAGLKTENSSLLDSFTQYKSNYLKLSNSINTPSVNPGISTPKIGNFSFDVNAGIGWDKFPLVINHDTTHPKYSGLGVTSHPLIQVGCTAGFFKNSTVSLSVSPFFSYGFDIGSGEKGHHLTYGANVDALIKLRKNSPLKLVLELGYTGRSGSMTRDSMSADYSYGVVRYGLGIRYTAPCHTCWIQPSIYFESPSSVAFGNTPSIVYNITTQIATSWQVSINYAKDYFLVGTVKYQPLTNAGTSDYFGLRILHNFKIK